jgi:hypothetical protein
VVPVVVAQGDGVEVGDEDVGDRVEPGETLAWLWPQLSEPARASLHRRVSSALAGFESTTACGIPLTEVAGRELAIERGADNLGTLADLQYAMIFYATLEHEIVPRCAAIGLDAARAWAERHS